MPTTKTEEMKQKLIEETQKGIFQKRIEDDKLARQIARVEALKELQARSMIKVQGNMVPLWDKVMEDAIAAGNQQDMYSYVDFRAAVCGLLALCCTLNKAIASSLEGTVDATMNMVSEVMQAQTDQENKLALEHPDSDYASRWKSIEVKDMPGINASVYINPTSSKLECKMVTRTDGMPVAPEVSKLFEVSVQEWLAENEYIQSTTEANTYLHVETGEPLTQERFTHLKEHGKPSLKEHFELEVSLEEQIELASTSRPNP